MAKLYGTDIDIDKYKFDYDRPVDTESFSITYTCVDGLEIGVAGPGDIMMINGREKSRKSAFAAGLLAGAFTDKEDDNSRLIDFGFNIKLRDKGVIAVFDTEHSLSQFGNLQKKFHHRIGKSSNIKEYNAYSIRDFTNYDDRINFIDRICQGIVASGFELDLIMHDQCGDLVAGVNDDYSVKFYQEKLMSMTEKYKCVAMPVLHTNRGGFESLGKLGAMLDKKATSIWNIVYDDDTKVSCASNSRARNMPVYKPICFHHNAEGYVELADELNL